MSNDLSLKDPTVLPEGYGQRQQREFLLAFITTMFGGGSVGSSWGNPQQNQQQPSAFGQPTGFGATNTGGGK